MRLREKGKGDLKREQKKAQRPSVGLSGSLIRAHTHAHSSGRERSAGRAAVCAGGSRGCRRASVYLNGEGRDSGSLRPLLPPEPASPSAERSGCTDLLSGVRYLHMTCPFVNLAPQLLASLHLCLPVPRTLQASARLSATSAACRAPPLAFSLLAHPPLSAQGHVRLGGCSALASPSLPLFLRSFSFSFSGCCGCCYCFSSSWETQDAGGCSVALFQNAQG